MKESIAKVKKLLLTPAMLKTLFDDPIKLPLELLCSSGGILVAELSRLYSLLSFH